MGKKKKNKNRILEFIINTFFWRTKKICDDKEKYLNNFKPKN